VLAGNPATSAGVLACFTTADTCGLRRLHPAVAGTVAGMPWSDTDTGTTIVDAVRWRAALPAAVGGRLSERAVAGLALRDAAVGAVLAGITRLDLHGASSVTDAMLRRLPASLHTLNVARCFRLTPAASLVHLRALVSLDCSNTKVTVRGLPESLQELNVTYCGDFHSHTPSLAHLTQLRVLRTIRNDNLEPATLASLPPSVMEVHAAACEWLRGTISLGHLLALQTLDVSGSAIANASLLCMPPSLVVLNVRVCRNLTPAAGLPPLPSLRLLDVSGTKVGDTLVGSLPACLAELHITSCACVTAGATLDHVTALRALYSADTALAPTVLAACRSRGCYVPAAGQLSGHAKEVTSLVVMAGGRLASGDTAGEVRVWDAAGARVTAVLHEQGLYALAALADGHRLATGLAGRAVGRIKVWDVDVDPPALRATVDCRTGALALAALADGRLAAGCDDGAVRVANVDAGTVGAALRGHTDSVVALADLSASRLASASWDGSVRVWDLAARVCMATLTGHTGGARALAVLLDGRLACGADDGTLRLWDVDAATCVSVLRGHTGAVMALAALPDGRLASGEMNGGAILLWDTRPAPAASSRAVGTATLRSLGQFVHSVRALAALPDDRLASASGGTEGTVHLLELPPS